MYKNDTAIRQRAISITSTNFVLGNFLGNGEIYFADYLLFMIFYGKLFLIHTWKNSLIRLTIN